MSPEEFGAFVAAEFELSDAPCLSARLVEDLGLDSLDLFDLVLFIEELAGATVDSISDLQVAYPILYTLADAYHYWEDIQSRLRV